MTVMTVNDDGNDAAAGVDDLRARFNGRSGGA